MRLDGDVEGTYTGEVSFGNDDPDENPFNFTVNGTVAIPPAVQIVDNGDHAFASVGEWKAWTGQGFQSDIHESFPGSRCRHGQLDLRPSSAGLLPSRRDVDQLYQSSDECSVHGL